jgi:hypothetical protein
MAMEFQRAQELLMEHFANVDIPGVVLTRKIVTSEDQLRRTFDELAEGGWKYVNIHSIFIHVADQAADTWNTMPFYRRMLLEYCGVDHYFVQPFEKG